MSGIVFHFPALKRKNSFHLVRVGLSGLGERLDEETELRI
jgi:hypothetical protein